MARPKGSKNKSTIEKEAATAGAPVASPSPSAGHNSSPMLSQKASDAIFIQELSNIEEWQGQIGSLVSKIRNSKKELKGAGWSGAQVTHGLEIRKNEAKDEVSKWRGLEDVHRALGHVLWTQAELFDGIDRTPAVDKAYKEGETCGIEGKKPCDPPYDASTPQGQEWIRGWHDGQAAIVAARMKPLGSTPAPGSTEPDFGEVLEDAPKLKGASAFRENVEAGDQHIRDTAAELAGQKETTH